ncbi:hypothetical protein [Amycolatopsis palatopharyngis]|uniref:hypothetical protein n=1 Tax=Amycolatopsis palatopharyngis TaxID=187982 RepID=UPI000E27072C|nr:hypothetical protein [Amycolatopsis palatopharyngis]
MSDSGGWSSPDPRYGQGQQNSGHVPPDQGLPPAPPPPGYGGPMSPMGHGKPGVIPLRPLRVGEILDGAITTMRRNPALMIGAAAAVMAVVQLLNALVLTTMQDQFQAVEAGAAMTEDEALDMLGDLAGASGITVVVTVLATTFLSGYLTVVIGKAVLGRPVRAGEVWSEIRPLLLPLLGLTVVYTLIVMVGLILLIIPGIWLYVLFALATPALVLERGRVFSSLGRSRLLVRGSWWRTFGILLLAAIIAGIISMIISIPFELFGDGASAFGNSTAMSTGGIWLSALGGVVAGAITYPFSAGVTALLYIDQRMRKEGMDIELARAAGTA